MVKTAEERFRLRARAALKDGQDFHARGEVNKAILEEVRAELGLEVAAGKKRIADSSYRATKKIKEAGDGALKNIQSAKHEALAEIATARCSTEAGRAPPNAILDKEGSVSGSEEGAPSGSEEGAPSGSEEEEATSAEAPDLATLEPKQDVLATLESEQAFQREVQAWQAELREFKRHASTELGEQEAAFQQRFERRAAESPDLLANLSDIPQERVDDYFKQYCTEYTDELQARTNMLWQAKDVAMMDARRKCRDCQEKLLSTSYQGATCDAHRAPFTEEDHAAIEAELQKSFRAVATAWAFRDMEEKRLVAETLRRESLARQKVQDEERIEAAAVAQDAGAEIRRRSGACKACRDDYDPMLGAFCPKHMQELEELKENGLVSPALAALTLG